MSLGGTYPADDGSTTSYAVVRLPLGLALIAAGTLAALLGIGSGVLKIPAMDAAMRSPLKVSSATANLMIGVTAAGAAGAQLLLGRVELGLAPPVVIGSVVGSVIGARILVGVRGAALRRLFVVVLILVASPMTLLAFGVLR